MDLQQIHSYTHFSCERSATELLIVHLSDNVQTSIALTGGDAPPTLGQHFSQLCGDKLVVLITRSLKVSYSSPKSEIITLKSLL